MEITIQQIGTFASALAACVAIAAYLGNVYGKKQSDFKDQNDKDSQQDVKIGLIQNNIKSIWKKIDAQEKAMGDLKDVDTDLKVLTNSFGSLERSFADIKEDFKDVKNDIKDIRNHIVNDHSPKRE